MAAALQRKCSGGISFVTITKIITKIIVPRNYCIIISASMVSLVAYVLLMSLEIAASTSFLGSVERRKALKTAMFWRTALH